MPFQSLFVLCTKNTTKVLERWTQWCNAWSQAVGTCPSHPLPTTFWLKSFPYSHKHERRGSYGFATEDGILNNSCIRWNISSSTCMIFIQRWNLWRLSSNGCCRTWIMLIWKERMVRQRFKHTNKIISTWYLTQNCC